MGKFSKTLTDKALKTYADYSPSDHTKINDAIMMCSDIDQSNQDHIGGVFKFAIIQGFVRYEDCAALSKSDPYLMNIIAGGLKTNVHEILKHQKTKSKYTTRQFFDGVLKYYDIIVDDFLKHKDAERKIYTKKPVGFAVDRAMVSKTSEPKHIFGR